MVLLWNQTLRCKRVTDMKQGGRHVRVVGVDPESSEGWRSDEGSQDLVDVFRTPLPMQTSHQQLLIRQDRADALNDTSLSRSIPEFRLPEIR